MNSNYFLILILFVTTSCGVKAPPVANDKVLSSDTYYRAQYQKIIDAEEKDKEEEDKEEDK